MKVILISMLFLLSCDGAERFRLFELCLTANSERITNCMIECVTNGGGVGCEWACEKIFCRRSLK